jgi:hypothetical protein
MVKHKLSGETLQFFQKNGKKGGLSRAKKYAKNKKKLREWGSRGGRPRKPVEERRARIEARTTVKLSKLEARFERLVATAQRRFEARHVVIESRMTAKMEKLDKRLEARIASIENKIKARRAALLKQRDAALLALDKEEKAHAT